MNSSSWWWCSRKRSTLLSAPCKAVHSCCPSPCLFYLLQILQLVTVSLKANAWRPLLIHAEVSDTQKYLKQPQKTISRLTHLFLFTDSHPHGISPPAKSAFPHHCSAICVSSVLCKLGCTRCIRAMSMVRMERSSFPLASHMALFWRKCQLKS